MFEVKFLVEDNKLHKAMWALDGITADGPFIVPVRGAKATSEGVVSAVSVNGLTQTVIDQLQTMQSPVNYTGLRDLYAQIGGKPEAIGNLIVRLIQKKVLKRITKGVFAITGTGTLQAKSGKIPAHSYLASLDGDNMVAKVVHLIKQQNIALLTLEDLGALAVEVGGSQNSNYFLRGQLIQHGILVDAGGGQYQVVN